MQADYYREIDELEKALKGSEKNQAELANLQSRLDGLMFRFKDDVALGPDKYALYQLQAMISYRQGDYPKAKRFIDYAVKLGGATKFSSELETQLMQGDFKPKNERVWWWLIFAPLGGLTAIALLQFIAQVALNKSDISMSSGLGLVTTVNALSAIVGIVSVLLLLCLPIWIIELVSAHRHNQGHGLGKGLSKTNGVVIAALLGVWYWAYTYRQSKTKFWVNFCLCIATVGYYGIVAWIWAIINAATRSDRFYDLYPYVKSNDR